MAIKGIETELRGFWPTLLSHSESAIVKYSLRTSVF